MYIVFEQEILVEESQSRITYGIEHQGGQERIGDLSVEKNEVERLADWMNRMEISPIHMQDVAEDWLAGL